MVSRSSVIYLPKSIAGRRAKYKRENVTFLWGYLCVRDDRPVTVQGIWTVISAARTGSKKRSHGLFRRPFLCYAQDSIRNEKKDGTIMAGALIEKGIEADKM